MLRKAVSRIQAWSSTHHHNILISHETNHHRYGRPFSSCAVAFDVDGVLVRGPIALPGARNALQKLKDNNIPFLLVTNGGGYLEQVKADQLSQILEVPITKEQIQLAHTPYKGLVEEYKYKPVLAVGKKNVHNILYNYGFRNIYDMNDLQTQFPGLFPDWKPGEKTSEFNYQAILDEIKGPDQRHDTGRDTNSHESIHKAIETDYISNLGRNRKLTQPLELALVLMDPLHYHRDAQILVDVVRSNGLRHLLTDSSSQSINTVSTVERSDLPLGSGPFPLYFAGLDLEYVTEFKYPRFGAGIFYLFVNTLYGEILKTNNIYSNSNDTGGQMAAANITPPPIGSGTRVLSSSLPGCNLNATLYGKPFPATYHYAEETLLKMDKNNLIQRGLDQQPNIKRRVYMVGDNPASDIKGANEAGWHSILVCTGMYSGGIHSNDRLNPAKDVVRNVEDAVNRILEHESKRG